MFDSKDFENFREALYNKLAEEYEKRVKDYKNGIQEAIIKNDSVFGYFESPEALFEDWRYIIHLRPGDIVTFRTRITKGAKVTEVKGLVLSIDIDKNNIKVITPVTVNLSSGKEVCVPKEYNLHLIDVLFGRNQKEMSGVQALQAFEDIEKFFNI